MTRSLNLCIDEICVIIQKNLETIEKLRYDHTVLKADNTPVTKADLYIESLIGDYLKANFDSLVFIGEENWNVNTDFSKSKYIAVLDPIDGTENFSSGLPEWGISIGFWENMNFVAGAIYLPELNKIIKTGDKVAFNKSRIIGLSSSVDQQLIDHIKIGEQYRIMGCAVYNIYNVIVGAYARFINPKGVYVWDFLPGAMLALEQGCKVTVNGEPFNGEFLNPNKSYKIEIIR